MVKKGHFWAQHEVLGNSPNIIYCKVCSYIARKEFLALHNAAIYLQALWRGISCSCIYRSAGSKCLCILSTPYMFVGIVSFFHVKSCEITMNIFQLFFFLF